MSQVLISKSLSIVNCKLSIAGLRPAKFPFILNYDIMISKLTNWYFSKKALPFWCILVIDCLLVLFADMFVYLLNNGALHTLQHGGILTGTFCFYLIFYIIGFRLFHTYAGIIRYSSFVDLQRIGFAMLTGLALTMVAKYVFHSDEWLMDIRTKDIGLAALLATALMWAVRVMVSSSPPMTA